MAEKQFTQRELFGEGAKRRRKPRVGLGFFKRCPDCDLWKLTRDFASKRSGKLNCYCSPCAASRSGRWHKRNKGEVNQRARERNRHLREEFIREYGGRCECCGEEQFAFLSIDHIDGGGKKHQQALGGGGGAVLRYLKRIGWPKEGYRILCYNCNCGRNRFGGVCPHHLPVCASPAPETPTAPTLRQCTRCELNKPLAEFFFHGGRPSSHCKLCEIAYRQDYRRLMRQETVMPKRAKVGIGVLKRCPKCDLWKVTGADFHSVQSWCKACARECFLSRRAQVNEVARERDRRIVAEVVAAYGGRCACCGETNPGFLTIDHIKGGGTRERKTEGGRGSLPARVKQEGFPRDRYQLLCFNCNMGKATGACCPHQRLPS